MGCFACEASTNDKDFVVESQYWAWYLADEQAYLGRSVILSKRHVGSISEIFQEEWLDLQEIITKVESSLKKAFGAEMFNWTCLLNDAYKSDNPNPHMHWHVRPRYRNEIEFAGKIFTDPDFGHHYNRERREKSDIEFVKEVADEIRKYL